MGAAQSAKAPTPGQRPLITTVAYTQQAREDPVSHNDQGQGAWAGPVAKRFSAVYGPSTLTGDGWRQRQSPAAAWQLGVWLVVERALRTIPKF